MCRVLEVPDALDPWIHTKITMAAWPRFILLDSNACRICDTFFHSGYSNNSAPVVHSTTERSAVHCEEWKPGRLHSKWSYPRPPFARCLASQSWHPGVWLNSMNTRLTKVARVEEMRIVDIKSLINSMEDSLLKVLPKSL